MLQPILDPPPIPPVRRRCWRWRNVAILLAPLLAVAAGGFLLGRYAASTPDPPAGHASSVVAVAAIHPGAGGSQEPVGFGTGYFSEAGGRHIVVTAAHVVRPLRVGAVVKVRLPDGPWRAGKLLAYAPGGLDAAAIQAPQSIARLAEPLPESASVTSPTSTYTTYSDTCDRPPSYAVIEYPLAGWLPYPPAAYRLAGKFQADRYVPSAVPALDGCSGGPVAVYISHNHQDVLGPLVLSFTAKKGSVANAYIPQALLDPWLAGLRRQYAKAHK